MPGYMLHPLLGRTLYTWRYTGVDTDGVDIVVPESLPDYDDMTCSVMVHIEGTVEVGIIEGESFDDSAEAHITSDGVSLTFDISKGANETLCTVKAPSDTIDVSCLALSRIV